MNRPRLVLHRRRRAIQAWARVRRERLAQGAEVAYEQERALLGALMLEPGMILLMSKTHPPFWFTDPVNLSIMRALVCLARGADAERLVAPELVAEILAAHGDDEIGAAEIRALMRPRPMRGPSISHAPQCAAMELGSQRAEAAELPGRLPRRCTRATPKSRKGAVPKNRLSGVRRGL